LRGEGPEKQITLQSKKQRPLALHEVGNSGSYGKDIARIFSGFSTFKLAKNVGRLIPLVLAAVFEKRRSPNNIDAELYENTAMMILFK
jgi:hypothetical protein